MAKKVELTNDESIRLNLRSMELQLEITRLEKELEEVREALGKPTLRWYHAIGFIFVFLSAPLIAFGIIYLIASWNG